MVGEALKGGRLIAKVMSVLGYKVAPSELTSVLERPSFITAVTVGSEEKMV